MTAMRVAFGHHWFGHYMREEAGKGETAQTVITNMRLRGGHSF